MSLSKTTSTTFSGRQQKNQQQQKTRQDDVVAVRINVLDDHIERLEAKLSFLTRSYDEDPRTDLLYQYEKKISTIKQEIDDAMEQRRRRSG
jgi:predicted RNase H-like nuclease (RuvC/YqgF family)